MNRQMLEEALTVALNRTHSKLVAQNGTLIIDDTNAHTGLSGRSIIAQSDSVIAVCTGLRNGVAFDFKANAGSNWVTIKAGIPIIGGDNDIIQAITLTSGSIALYS